MMITQKNNNTFAIHDPLTRLSGIGEKKEKLLSQLGIYDINDLLLHYPRRYEDRRNIKKISTLALGETALIKATVDFVNIPQIQIQRNARIPMKLQVSDGSSKMSIVFFNYKYLKNIFRKGEEFYFYGTVTPDLSSKSMVHPDFEKADENVVDNVSGIVPIYPLTSGITQRYMRGLIKQAENAVGAIPESLPKSLIEKRKLAPIDYAIRNIHFPEEMHALKAARYRLIFEEIFTLILKLSWLRKNNDEDHSGISFNNKSAQAQFLKLLPFSPTNAQSRVIDEIGKDMESTRPMHRLLQGDVGSGKTAVAMAASYNAVSCGYQVAVMVPTEILANQHFEEFKSVFAKCNKEVNIGFLASGLAQKEKTAIKSQLKNGEIDILIGTHAIIESDVIFSKLGLVVTDEQHRFGVNQRLKLKEKGDKSPDVLVMTATPIPRSLALVLYGDLDISIIDEMPPGRKQIDTRFIGGSKRNDAYNFAAKEIEKGRQVYVVAPAIEEKDEEDMTSTLIDMKTAEGLYAELTKKYPKIKMKMIFGSMKTSEKDEIMRLFSLGEIDMLIATVVIEVGINIPNATVMIIENTERFGLAQLHQLRGRVGRGSEKSYCILISDSKSEIAVKRGEAIASTNDGFKIAEMDLELRGPGDMFGIKQHGLPELKIADLAKHVKIVSEASGDVKKLFNEDPTLKKKENAILKGKLTNVEIVG